MRGLVVLGLLVVLGVLVWALKTIDPVPGLGRERTISKGLVADSAEGSGAVAGRVAVHPSASAPVAIPDDGTAPTPVEPQRTGAENSVVVSGHCLDIDGSPMAGASIFAFAPHSGKAVQALVGKDGSFQFVIPSGISQGDYVQASVDEGRTTVFSGLIRCARGIVILVESSRHDNWRIEGDMVVTGADIKAWSVLVYSGARNSRLLAASDLRNPWRDRVARVSALFLLPQYRKYEGEVVFCIADRASGYGVVFTKRYASISALREALSLGMTCHVREQSMHVASAPDGTPIEELKWSSVDQQPPRGGGAAVDEGTARVVAADGDYYVQGLGKDASGSERVVAGYCARFNECTKIQWAVDASGTEKLRIRCRDPMGAEIHIDSVVLRRMDVWGQTHFVDIVEPKHGAQGALVDGLAPGNYSVPAVTRVGDSAMVSCALPAREVLDLVVATDRQAGTLKILVTAEVPELLDCLSSATVFFRRRGELSWSTREIANGIWTIENWEPGEFDVAVQCGEWRGTCAVTGAGAHQVAQVRLDALVRTPGRITGGAVAAGGEWEVAVSGAPPSPWAQCRTVRGAFELWIPAGRRVVVVVRDHNGMVKDTRPCVAGDLLDIALAD